MHKRNIGSDFDDFLRDEGILEEADAVATKRIIAYQIAQERVSDDTDGIEMSNKALHWTGIPLRFIPASELYVRQQERRNEQCLP